MSLDTHHLRREFPVTEWTMIRKANDPDSEGALTNLETLLHQYLPALKAHLVNVKHLSEDRAEDLVQGFVTDQVLVGNLLANTDQEKGRFRNFLLTAFDRYVVSIYRKEQAAKRYPEGGFEPLQEAVNRQTQGVHGSECFDVEWTQQVIAQSLSRVEKRCAASGRKSYWALFHAKVVAPALDGAETVGYAELIKEFDFKSPLQASNALLTVKRMFQREFRAVVAEYCATEAELDEEIRSLNAILATSSTNLL